MSDLAGAIDGCLLEFPHGFSGRNAFVREPEVLTADVSAGARLRQHYALVIHDSATRKCGLGETLDFKSLEYIKVNCVMMGLFADGLGGFGVPDKDVGVGTLLDHSLARVHVEDLSGLRGGRAHEV